MVVITAETMAYQSMAEEVEAINAYTDRLSRVINQQLRDVILHNTMEEKTHANNIGKWLQDHTAYGNKFRLETYDEIKANPLKGGFQLEGNFSSGLVSDVVIAQDSLREEIRAIEAYDFRIKHVVVVTETTKALIDIFFSNKLDEMEHAYNLLSWLGKNNTRWHDYIKASLLSFDVLNTLPLAYADKVKRELDSFMPSYQEEWAPWWGPKPTSGSGSKTTRTSRGGPTSRDKITYIKGLQATNLSINMQPLQQWFSNTDRIITKWRKVKVKKNVWDPNAYDTTFNRQGAIIEKEEETMVPPPQFVKRWGRRIVIDKPEGTYRIDAGATAKKGYPGNYLVTLYISPRMTTAGQSYKLREEEYAMLYKKDMSVEECEYKTDELIRLIKSL